ncbi:MAG: phage major capsid protein [Dehalococcoidia bacterium]
MNEELRKALEAIEAGIGRTEKSQGELEAAQAKDAVIRQELLDKIKTQDGRLESQQETLVKLEADLVKSRFGTGQGIHETDTLRNALPERIRRFSGDLHRSTGFKMIQRNAAGSPLADAIVVAGCMGWFQAKINSVICMSKGNPNGASKWADEGRTIEDALNKLAPKRIMKADLQEDTADEGGDLVPVILEAVIGWLMKDASVVRQSGPTIITMTSNKHELPKLANDFTVGWFSEEGTITDSTPASPFAKGSLVAHKQGGLVTISNELLQDNIINIMDFIMVHLTQQLGRAEDTEALEGTGSSPAISGLFTVSGVNAIAGGSNALTFQELVKLIYGGEETPTMDGGVIYAHPWIMRDALQLTTGAAGGPFFIHPTIDPVNGNFVPRNILGVPTFLTTSIDRLRTANDTTVYHGNPRFIVIGDRQATTFVVNPWGGKNTEGTPNITSFEKDQVLLRLTRRVGILIWVPEYFTKLNAVLVVA